MICNACGREGKPSKEHFLHVHIARVLTGIGDDVPGPEVRKLLRTGHLGEYERRVPSEGTRLAHLPDKVIQGMICRPCNAEWANDLEIAAVRELSVLLSGRRRPRLDVLRRWAWYFGVKAWWIDRSPDVLRDGLLHPILSQLAKPDCRIQMPIRLARLDKDSDRWMFGLWIEPEGAGFRYVGWVTRAVAWFILPQEPGPRNPLPFRTRELQELYLGQYPLIRAVELLALPAVRASIEAAPA
jgi:hypothetical protein